MLKLKLQYFGHLMQRTDSFEKTLMLGKFEGKRRRGRQKMRWLDGITDSMDESGWTPGVGDGQGGLACYDSWRRKESDTTEQLNWTELKMLRDPGSQSWVLNCLWKLWFKLLLVALIFSLRVQLLVRHRDLESCVPGAILTPHFADEKLRQWVAK